MITAFRLLPSAFRLLPSAFCFLPSAFCLPPSAFCLPPSAFCLLPSAFCLLPSATCLLLLAFCLLVFHPHCSVLEVLLLPDGNDLLQTIDCVMASLKGYFAMGGRYDDDHTRLCNIDAAKSMNHTNAIDG